MSVDRHAAYEDSEAPQDEPLPVQHFGFRPELLTPTDSNYKNKVSHGDILHRLFLLGVSNGDSPEVRAQKSIAFYSAFTLLSLMLLYVIYLFAINSKSRTEDKVTGLVVVLCLVVLLFVYVKFQSHVWLRRIFTLAAVLFPIVHSTSHGCKSIIHGGGTIFSFLVPSTAVYLLTGGSNLFSNLLLVIHVIVMTGLYSFEYVLNSPTFDRWKRAPCPTPYEELPIGWDLFGTYLISAAGILTSIFCLRSFKKANDTKAERLKYEQDLATRLAQQISLMHLEEAKGLLTSLSSRSPLEVSLLNIVLMLERVHLFLPDAVNIRDPELKTPMSSPRSPKRNVRGRDDTSSRSSNIVIEKVSSNNNGIPNLSLSRVTKSNNIESPRSNRSNKSHKSNRSAKSAKNESRWRGLGIGSNNNESNGRWKTLTKQVHVAAAVTGFMQAVQTKPLMQRSLSLASNQDCKVNLSCGLSRRHVSLLWIDVMLFNQFLENCKKSDEIASFMNEVLSGVLEVVRSLHGNIAVIQGGRLLACWNATSNVPLHSKLASDAALLILNKIAKWPKKLRAVMAIVSEYSIVGTVGTDVREFVCMGKGLNKLERMSSLAKKLKTQVIVTAQVNKQICMEFRTKAVDVVLYENESIILYELLGRNNTKKDDEWMYQLADVEDNAQKLYAKAFDDYKNGRYDAAMSAFMSLNEGANDLQIVRLVSICTAAMHEKAEKSSRLRNITNCVHLWDGEKVPEEWSIQQQRPRQNGEPVDDLMEMM